MSKIICEVCGSSYSDSEACCPICGTAKPEDMEVQEETVESAPKSRRTSDSPRRNRTSKSAGVDSSNKMLVIIAAVLAVAIIIVGVFCLATCSGCTSCAGSSNDNPSDTESSTTLPSEPNVGVTNIRLKEVLDADGNVVISSSSSTLTITDQYATYTIVAQNWPLASTEAVTYTYISDNERVVVVTEDGVIHPVSNGSATITVCGVTAYYGNEYDFSINVTCKMEGFEDPLEINVSELTLSEKNGTSYDMYTTVRNSSQYDKSKFTLESSDTDVVSVDGTKVVAVADGTATVTMYYAKDTEYQQSVEFKVVVRLSGSSSTTGYSLSHTDVTINLGDETQSKSFTLSLKDSSGNAVTGVTWSFSSDFNSYCSYSINNGAVTITGINSTEDISSKRVAVSTTYDGVTYTCEIYVKG